MAESIDIVANTIQNNLDHKEFDWSTLKQDLREDLGHFLYEQTHRHPVILPVIMEINQNKLRSQSRKHPTNTSN